MHREDDFRVEEDEELDEGEKIEQGFTQMEVLYRSRCVQAPNGISNVVVKEIKKDE